MSENLINNDTQLDLASKAIVSMEKAADRRDENQMITVVENTVASYLGKAMDIVLESNKLSEVLEQSLAQDILDGKMDIETKITTLNIERSARNDANFKLISPSIGFLTARQQAMIAAAAKQDQQAAVQVNVGSGVGNARDAAIAASVPPEVASGFDAIFELINRRRQIVLSTSEAGVVDAEATVTTPKEPSEKETSEKDSTESQV